MQGLFVYSACSSHMPMIHVHRFRSELCCGEKDVRRHQAAKLCLRAVQRWLLQHQQWQIVHQMFEKPSESHGRDGIAGDSKVIANCGAFSTGTGSSCTCTSCSTGYYTTDSGASCNSCLGYRAIGACKLMASCRRAVLSCRRQQRSVILNCARVHARRAVLGC